MKIREFPLLFCSWSIDLMTFTIDLTNSPPNPRPREGYLLQNQFLQLIVKLLRDLV